jgi:hypothetical protein
MSDLSIDGSVTPAPFLWFALTRAPDRFDPQSVEAARWPDDAVWPTALRAGDVYAGTERPEKHRFENELQADLLSTVAEHERLESVPAHAACVKQNEVRICSVMRARKVAHRGLVRELHDCSFGSRVEHCIDAFRRRSRDHTQLRVLLLDPPHVVCV